MTAWKKAITGGSRKDLVQSVERAVSTGALAPGQPLPSVRVLASHLGLSATTVASAVTELRRRGVIVTSERRTSVVAPTPPLKLDAAPATPPPAPSGVDLSHGGPDRALLPSLEPALKAVAADNRMPRVYGQSMMDPDLRDLVLPQLDDLGLSDFSEHLGLTSGALDLVERALLVTSRPGDRVIVEDPGYPDVFDLLRAIGLQAVPVRIDDEGILPDSLRAELRRGAAALVHTPGGQNPFGSGLTDRRARQLAHVLSEVPDIVVIEDHHLSLVEPPRVTLAGRVERWAIVRSVAKSLGPDLRLAFVAAEPWLFSRVVGRHALGPGWVSHILQRTIVHLLRDQDVQRQIRVAGETYDARRHALLTELRHRGVHAHGSTGLNVWVPVTDEGAASLDLANQGWVVSPGGRYRAACPPGLRITTSTLAVDDAPALADAVAQALRRRASRSG